MKKKRTALLQSVIALILCVAMLAGSTFAWFTDSTVSTGNIIKSGKLDLEVYWAEDLSGTWNDVENADTNKIFDYQYWEPGYTQVRYIKIVNAGDLAFRYALEIKPNGTVSDLADVIDVYAVPNPTAEIGDHDSLTGYVGTLRDAISGDITAAGELTEGEVVVAIALKMREDAGNDYQNKSIGDSFGITISATQYTYESDSFGSDYDADAQFPALKGDASGSAAVTTENGVTTGDTTITTNTDVTAEVPAGVKVAEGAETLDLAVANQAASKNITLNSGEVARSYDVHISGVAEDNDVPMIINMGAVMPAGLALYNVRLVHVEDGVPVEMTLVDTLSAHNQFTYNPATGEVSLCLASFSEVATIADADNSWDGKTVDTSWYNTTATEFTLNDAADFAGFARIVGGMAEGIEIDDFSGKTVKLGADISLGNKIWYPIGYHNSTGNYNKVSGGSVTSDVSSFEGTFDGQGHTISNFYQNTWDMFGDYNSGYEGTPNHYKDGMGIFGFVYNGTVKNLTVKNFQSDGEFCTTGVVAAYASGSSTFENITILNSNPRAYNVPNGGVVGYAYDEDGAANVINFNNVKVDSSNKITALWGSWDVGCGGILGRVNGATTVNMTNCEVGAVIDVYNDVCANYQYYQYRYSGMLIGTVGGDGDPQSGDEKVNFSNVTVYVGDWADYYYCEFVENSEASYSEDYQFSRVERNEIVFDEYNMPTGCTHDHIEGVEDRLAYYLPFNQLYTGYGWGASPVSTADGVTVTQYFYMITYRDADESLIEVEYVTAGQSDDTHNVANAKEITKTHSAAGKTFDGWINVGGTEVTKVDTGNRKDIVLYATYANVYTARWVDEDGNVIHSQEFTSKTNAWDEVEGPKSSSDVLVFDHWEIRNDDGSSDVLDEKKPKSVKDNITIYPYYAIEKGENAGLGLTGVDEDGDGRADYYTVEAVDAGNIGKDVTIPGEINGVPVKYVTDLSSGWASNVENVVIKEGVEEIGSQAFGDTSSLKTVELPSTIKKIGDSAFAGDLSNWGDAFGVYEKPLKITYNGTRADWDQVVANSGKWEDGLTEGATVICTDGTYTLTSKGGNVITGYTYNWTWTPKSN